MDVYDHKTSAMQRQSHLHELITSVMSSHRKLLKTAPVESRRVFAQFATPNCLCATTGMSTTVDKLQ